MNYRKKIALLAALFVLLLLSSLNTHSQVWKSDKDRLLEGDVLITFKEVPDTLVNEVQAKIYFDAPPQMVWEVLTDYADYSKLFKDITSCNVISKQDGKAKLEIMINNLWPYPNFNYKMNVVEDGQNYKISWKMEEGNLRMLFGSASLEKFPEDKDTTCLTYSMVRDPGWISPFVSPTLSNRAVVVERVMALRQKIREKKAELEGEEKEIKPKWEKALFWWQKDEDNDKEKQKPSKDKKKEEEKETD